MGGMFQGRRGLLICLPLDPAGSARWAVPAASRCVTAVSRDSPAGEGPSLGHLGRDLGLVCRRDRHRADTAGPRPAPPHPKMPPPGPADVSPLASLQGQCLSRGGPSVSGLEAWSDLSTSGCVGTPWGPSPQPACRASRTLPPSRSGPLRLACAAGVSGRHRLGQP